MESIAFCSWYLVAAFLPVAFPSIRRMVAFSFRCERATLGSVMGVPFAVVAALRLSAFPGPVALVPISGMFALFLIVTEGRTDVCMVAIPSIIATTVTLTLTVLTV